MKKIGITGGIGSGKSTVSKYISLLGYKVIDADKIALDLAVPNSKLLKTIKNEFGASIILKDGNLDRKKLGSIVFNNPDEREKLDKIFQPIIKEEILRQFDEIEKSNSPDLVFLDAPLIFEVGLNKEMDKVWLVDADIDKRIQRIKDRDNISVKEINARISSQMSRNNKILLADEVIDNNLNIETLKKAVEKLIEKELK